MGINLLMEECSLTLTPREANLPTFPNKVEHRKPNLPTTLAAALGVRTPFSSMVDFKPVTLLGLAFTEKILERSMNSVSKTQLPKFQHWTGQCYLSFVWIESDTQKLSGSQKTMEIHFCCVFGRHYPKIIEKMITLDLEKPHEKACEPFGKSVEVRNCVSRSERLRVHFMDQRPLLQRVEDGSKSPWDVFRTQSYLCENHASKMRTFFTRRLEPNVSHKVCS